MEYWIALRQQMDYSGYMDDRTGFWLTICSNKCAAVNMISIVRTLLNGSIVENAIFKTNKNP
jgi:hypothetical protein